MIKVGDRVVFKYNNKPMAFVEWFRYLVDNKIICTVISLPDHTLNNHSKIYFRPDQQTANGVYQSIPDYSIFKDDQYIISPRIKNVPKDMRGNL